MTERGLAAQFWYDLLWYPCWAFAKLWFRFRWSRQEQVPADGPLLLVSNHQSHLDPVLVGIACPRQLRFLARKTLFFWPLSWLIRSLGAVPIDLTGSGIGGVKVTLQLLRAGQAVLVFPEGTRTEDGQLQPLEGGFAAIARRSGAAIVPLAIDGAFAALPRGTSWPRWRPIRLTFGEMIPAEAIANQTDAELANLVHARIAALLPAHA
jgi:1-acyl-sn-glycerol-3-phosphate acyltransferase